MSSYRGDTGWETQTRVWTCFVTLVTVAWARPLCISARSICRRAALRGSCSAHGTEPPARRSWFHLRRLPSWVGSPPPCWSHANMITPLRTRIHLGGAWVAQLAKHLTGDFGLGRDLRVVGWSPASGSVLNMESASLSSSALSPACVHTLLL